MLMIKGNRNVPDCHHDIFSMQCKSCMTFINMKKSTNQPTSYDKLLGSSNRSLIIIDLAIPLNLKKIA